MADFLIKGFGKSEEEHTPPNPAPSTLYRPFTSSVCISLHTGYVVVKIMVTFWVP